MENALSAPTSPSREPRPWRKAICRELRTLKKMKNLDLERYLYKVLVSNEWVGFSLLTIKVTNQLFISTMNVNRFYCHVLTTMAVVSTSKRLLVIIVDIFLKASAACRQMF